jgi:iron complex outermembrane receptor protein
MPAQERAVWSVAAIVAVCALAPGAALAQRAGENAVADAEDAFGTAVGLESSGIYSEFDTRGFSPTKAGNVRIDGIYFDPVGVLAFRLRASTAIRVGFAAEDYPFHAPTGIVDHKFKPFPEKLGASLAYNRQAYGGFVAEFDMRVPVIADRLSLTGGSANSDLRQVDGSGNHGFGYTLRPILRLGDVQVAPFATIGGFRQVLGRPLVVVSGDFLPQLPPVGGYLGQTWAKGSSNNNNFGVTVKAAISDRLSLRGGLFHADGPRLANFTEVYSLIDASGLARHRLIADPRQEINSTSGEAQIALRLDRGAWQHRLIAGFRARNRLTESGGSAVRNYLAPVIYGEPDPQPEERFAYGPVNAVQVRQSSLLLGYTGKLAGVGTLNLGLQKARYRGSARDGRTGLVSLQRDDPWLYNATLGLDLTRNLSIYLGTEKGLEDSGAAPENAVNRNEQLPATRTVQYEGGVRWKFRGGQLVVNAFQIEKPYFSFDTAGAFVQLGNVRHRGVEASLTGHFGKRLNVVAGALALQPRVTGAARDLGLVGERPAGTPSLFVRIDANYRTDIFGGLTPTLTFIHTGARAVGARPLTPGGRQLMVPGYSTLDLGARQQFKVGSVPASFRIALNNVFDAATWKVVAANTLYPEDRRRLTFTLSADF